MGILLQVNGGPARRVPIGDGMVGWRMQDPTFVRTFLYGDRSGAHLRIVEPGAVRAGDGVQVVHRPDHAVTVTDVMAQWRGDDIAAHILTAGDTLHAETRARAETHRRSS